MSMDMMEYQITCWNCGRNIFEAVEDGKCIYCGHPVDDEEDDIIDGVV